MCNSRHDERSNIVNVISLLVFIEDKHISYKNIRVMKKINRLFVYFIEDNKRK